MTCIFLPNCLPNNVFSPQRSILQLQCVLRLKSLLDVAYLSFAFCNLNYLNILKFVFLGGINYYNLHIIVFCFLNDLKCSQLMFEL